MEAFPKPVQQPFPVFVGGHNLNAIERAVKFGSGWLPGWRPFSELREWIVRLREKSDGPIEVAPQFTVTIAVSHEEAVRRYLRSGMVQHRKSLAYTGRDPNLALDNNLIGSADSIRAKLAELEDMGVGHCCALTFPTATVDEMLEQMHMFAEAVL